MELLQLDMERPWTGWGGSHERTDISAAKIPRVLDNWDNWLLGTFIPQRRKILPFSFLVQEMDMDTLNSRQARPYPRYKGFNQLDK